MPKTIYDMDWESLLPEPLKSDKRIYAAAKAIAKQKRAVADAIWNTRVWMEIDNLPEQILDLLAYDLDIRWYDGDYSLETKRSIIKSAFHVYKALGTKGAVKQALKNVYDAVEVYEWFEYGGEPYRFRVLIDTTNKGETISHNQIEAAIRNYKPVRAWLDYIAYMNRVGIGIGVSTKVYYLDYDMCGTQPDISTGLAIHKEHITATWSGKGYGTEIQMTSSDLIAGEQPEVSTGLKIHRGGILSGVTGTGYYTEYAMCGDDMP